MTFPANPTRDRVRFRESSAFARDFGIPRGQRATIAHRYLDDDRYKVDLQIEGGHYCWGVPADELVVDAGAVPSVGPTDGRPAEVL